MIVTRGVNLSSFRLVSTLDGIAVLLLTTWHITDSSTMLKSYVTFRIASTLVIKNNYMSMFYYYE